jgi:DhnA family fructose-bisphosphate aldolase class Ia
MPISGESIRLARLFSEGKNAVVVAVDHGLYFGPLAGMINLPSVIDRVSGADAVLMAPGMPAHCQSVFSKRGAPACIVRLNWGSNYAAMWKYKHSHSVPMLSVADAVAQGADLVIGSLSLKNPDEAEDAHNVEVFSACVAQKRTLGIPLIGEVYPTGGDDYPPEELQEQIFIGCRIISELGADLVKTFYTGKGFKEITAATPVPVLALGAKKLPRECDALELAEKMKALGVEEIIYTDITKDGMLEGPNLDGLRSIASKSGLKVIASGGVTTLEDIKNIKALETCGVAGAIVGKALYTEDMKLEDAIKIAEKE